MAFAPFTAQVAGAFRERDTGNLFEYAERTDVADGWLAADFPHRIFLTGDETRVARVLRTVAYIVVDETMTGEPVVEKWFLKSNRVYR